jgi:hypothetical protein
MNACLGIFLALAAVDEPPVQANWCKVGQMVVIPDGREGPVTGVSGEICKVLVYGERYVSLWTYYMIDPAYPRYGR